MNIEKIVLDIARSGSEKKFSACIATIANENIQVQKKICHNVFKQFDIEVEKETQNEVFLGTLISIPVELAIFHQNLNENNQIHDLIEFISSHFLARSNGTNASLRLAMMIFYSTVKNQSNWKKQRILERFGENILNNIFNLYSTDKSKSSLAFSFLSENLESFLSLSSELAAMTNSFLQTYMFKHPMDFIVFIHQYKNYLLTKEVPVNFFPIHLSFLIRQSFELEHEELSLHLSKIFIDYVHNFEDKNDYIESTFQTLAKIMLQSKTLSAKEVGVYIQNELNHKHKISFKNLIKSLGLKNTKNSFSVSIKPKKSTGEMSSFQKILLLCSNV